MAEITRESSRIGSLLASTSRVEAPFVCVTLGGYTFGVYQSKSKIIEGSTGKVSTTAEKYPNYIQGLTVKKINGTVNNYTVDIAYPITEKDDPNFFEKIFSRAGIGGHITFSYGDSMLPNYIYRDEDAIITNVTNSFDIAQSKINYKIEAWSASKLALSGTHTFPTITMKPSEKIMSILYNENSKYHLLDVFKGMKNRDLVIANKLIADDDDVVTIPTCANMSILEYISFLVSYMSPNGSDAKSVVKSNVYSLTTYDDTSEIFGGSYFKVQKIIKASNQLNKLCTYDIDIGYPTANIIERFDIKNNENWSIFYKYNNNLDNSDYLKRINEKGELEYIYSPQLSNTNYKLNENDRTWWTKVTQYPTSATMTLKGLLRPVVLMTYVKLNVWFFGKKHIASGYYLITSQVDNITTQGYKTTLDLLRVAPDDDIELASLNSSNANNQTEINDWPAGNNKPTGSKLKMYDPQWIKHNNGVY